MIQASRNAILPPRPDARRRPKHKAPILYCAAPLTTANQFAAATALNPPTDLWIASASISPLSARPPGGI